VVVVAGEEGIKLFSHSSIRLEAVLVSFEGENLARDGQTRLSDSFMSGIGSS
jgi:hypothetical protein